MWYIKKYNFSHYSNTLTSLIFTCERDIYIDAIKKSQIVSYVIKYIGTTVYKYTCKYVCIFNLQGRTPLYVAVFFSHTQLVEILMEKGADPNCRYANVSTNYI